MNNQSWIMLLGRRNQPIDGVRDYLAWLSAALQRQGVVIEQVEIPWVERGWLSALWWTWKAGIRWRGKWIIVQYNAFSWSTNGIPIAFLLLLLLLKAHRVRLAIMFHDPRPHPVSRIIHHIRYILQWFVMRLVYSYADRVIFNVPLRSIDWLPTNLGKATFIPVGGSIPQCSYERTYSNEQKTIAVFGITGGVARVVEVEDITHVARHLLQYVPALRLLLVGYGTDEASHILRTALQHVTVGITTYGVVPDQRVADILASADMALFVRGGISTQRSSAMASIAAGLPIVAYAGADTGYPLTEAGLVTVPYRKREALAQAATQVLTDKHLWQKLHHRSIHAQQTYFSWDRIAQRYLEELIYV